MPAISRPIRIAAVLHLENEHGHGILRGIAHAARDHAGLHVLKFSKPAALTAEFLRKLGVQGLITKISDPREEKLLLRLGLPAVNISGERATPRLAAVNTDDRLLGALAAQYFQRRGHRFLAYCGNETHQASRLRREGMEAEARRLGCAFAAHVLPRDRERALRPESTRRALARWMRALPHPAGVLAFNDLVAHEIALGCELARLRIPDDIAILGIGNDLTRLEFSVTALSSVALNTRQIGGLALEKLLALIAGRPAGPRETLVRPLKIVTRASTDKFAVADEVVSLALDYIREHVSNTVYVAEVARAVGVSRRGLEVKFRRILNSSVYAEVQRGHFERAVELMAETELTVGEIAYASGFESAARFSTAFRRHHGCAPVDYKTRLLNRTGAAPGASGSRR